MRGEQRPCKFGPNCNKLAQGMCTFYHPPSDMNNMQPHQSRNKQGSGFNHHSYQGNFQTKNFNQNNQNFNQGNYHQSNPRQQGNNFNQNYNQNQNFGQKGFREGAGSEDMVQKQLCRNFHLGTECKYGQKCRSKHAFTITQQELIKRLHFIREVPFHPQTKLSTFKSGDKDYFSMRNGNDVNFFDFNYQTKALGDVFKYSFPDPNGRYNFYEQKNEFVFFSKDNSDTVYQDMGIYNLQQMKTFYVSNSHQGKVTGIAQFDNNVFFSTSMLGELKVWIAQDHQLVCHNQIIQRLRSNFNPQNAKLELYFIDISEVNGIKIIAIGTSDGRLLFFFGNDLTFKQVVLTEQYARVFKIKYTMRQNVPTALLLTWNIPKTACALLEVDLINFSTSSLIQIRTTEDQPKAMINTFEMVHGYLMVANLYGFVSIYNYPDTNNKIGGIFHQNQVSDIIATESEIKNTNIKMKMMFILEKRTEQKEGSLGIYVMK